MRDTILAITSAVKEGHPVIDGHGCGVKLDAIQEDGGRAIDTLSSAVLPKSTSVTVGVVGVVIAVAASYIGLLKFELGGDLLCPPGLKSVLRLISHSKNGSQVLEGKVLVLSAVAALSFSTEGHEVGHELGDLV